MSLIMLIAGIVIVIYSIAFHKKGSKRKFDFIQYWNSLTAKGSVIYTIGLALVVWAIIRML